MSEYRPLDEETMGDIAYSLKTHNPELNKHYEGYEKTPKEMKEAVLRSDHLKRVMRQVMSNVDRSNHWDRVPYGPASMYKTKLRL